MDGKLAVADFRCWCRLALSTLIALAVAVSGCATTPTPLAGGVATPARGAPFKPPRIDAAVAQRLLVLDPDRVTARDVREVLAFVPAPHIILEHGGVFPVYLAMTSLAKFLKGMGYPEDKLRHPGDGRYSHSPYESSEQIAGLVAWYYEHDGVRPMLIGHSQGGIQVIRVLHDLAGTFSPSLPVWNPLSDAPEPRTKIVDPLTGRKRPVVGLSVSYASVVGAGGPSGILPNHWKVVSRLREIPDSVDEFTGYHIGVDFFAWTFAGAGISEFRNHGRARVNNVVLPADYLHVTVPVTHHLVGDPAMKQWIESYTPRVLREGGPVPGTSLDNVLYAADIWYSVKRHWVLEAQRLVMATRQKVIAR